jgi:hypothetical protein
MNIPEVLASCRWVMDRARHLRIDSGAVTRFAQRLVSEPASAPDELTLRGPRDDVANFILITDALNFCFWADPSLKPWRVEFRGRSWTRTQAMMAGMLRAVEQDRDWLSAQRWADATDDDVAGLFAGTGCIPLARQRRDVLRETGAILAERSAGQFSRLVDAAEGDALALTYRLAETFPSFRDVAKYAGEPVAFLKRAQICAADLHRAWQANGLAGLGGMEALTVFADYRLPQLFRHAGMLVVSDELAERIGRGEQLAAGGTEEVELRAATVVIGADLCAVLGELGHPRAAWEIDYELWVRAKQPRVTVPHHRTVTWYY